MSERNRWQPGAAHEGVLRAQPGPGGGHRSGRRHPAGAGGVLLPELADHRSRQDLLGGLRRRLCLRRLVAAAAVSASAAARGEIKLRGRWGRWARPGAAGSALATTAASTPSPPPPPPPPWRRGRAMAAAGRRRTPDLLESKLLSQLKGDPPAASRRASGGRRPLAAALRPVAADAAHALTPTEQTLTMAEKPPGSLGDCLAIMGPKRGASLATGPFLRPALRTRRATFTAPGSPQIHAAGDGSVRRDQGGVDPVWWTPDFWGTLVPGRRSSLCRTTIRRSFAGRWSSWCARDGRRLICRMASARMAAITIAPDMAGAPVAPAGHEWHFLAGERRVDHEGAAILGRDPRQQSASHSRMPPRSRQAPPALRGGPGLHRSYGLKKPACCGCAQLPWNVVSEPCTMVISAPIRARLRRRVGEGQLGSEIMGRPSAPGGLQRRQRVAGGPILLGSPGVVGLSS